MVKQLVRFNSSKTCSWNGRVVDIPPLGPYWIPPSPPSPHLTNPVELYFTLDSTVLLWRARSRGCWYPQVSLPCSTWRTPMSCTLMGHSKRAQSPGTSLFSFRYLIQCFVTYLLFGKMQICAPIIVQLYLDVFVDSVPRLGWFTKENLV